MSATAAASARRVRSRASGAPPRLGFLGTGWIGRARLRSVADSGLAEVAAVADPDAGCLQSALELAPRARGCASIEELLDQRLDGIVIATPSALHAAQARAALQAGVAVFCQKPLGRDAGECGAVLDCAQDADRLLGVDLCYRRTAAAQALAAQLRAGAIGPVHAVDLVFHNAYGPDKPWFLDPALSGGGCVIDLGVHLVDLLLWALGFPAVLGVSSTLWRGGLRAVPGEAEDMCLAMLELEGGAVARLACSWFSHEGRDAVIEATFRGRDGALSLHNVGGSFYDLRAERRHGTSCRSLAEPPDEWPGRTILDWVARLGSDAGFDAAAREIAPVAATLDAVYGR